MPPKKAQRGSVQVRHPQQYIFTYMINRFALDRQDGFVVAYFGLANKENEIIDKFSCILPQSTLESCKENLVEFSEFIGPPKVKLPAWNPKSTAGKAEGPTLEYSIIDFIHLTNWEDKYAELCFWNYSRAALADLKKMPGEQFLNPWGVALIRCDIDLQRAFLAELYA